MSAQLDSDHADVLRLVRRLQGIIVHECETIRADPAADISAIVESKNRCMYELELALAGERDLTSVPDAEGAVSDLRDALDDNSRLLDAHMAAVGDALLMVEQLSGVAQGDGTYANPARPKGYL